MSIILDALKRAERDRSIGRAPDVTELAKMTPGTAPKKQRDRLWIAVLAIMLLAAAIVIATLLLHRHGQQPGVIDADNDTPKLIAAPDNTRPAVAPPTVDAAQTPPAQPAQPAQPTLRAGPPAIANGDSVASLDDVTPPNSDAGEQAEAADVAASSSRPTGKIAAAPPPGGPTLHAVDAEPTQPDTQSGTQADDSQADAGTTAAAPTSAAAPVPVPAKGGAAASDVQPLSKMPESYRSEFPQFNVDVHVYDDNPQRRFLIIGSATFHEGGTLPAGPTIVSIVPDGMVLSWKGQRVLYLLNH